MRGIDYVWIMKVVGMNLGCKVVNELSCLFSHLKYYNRLESGDERVNLRKVINDFWAQNFTNKGK
jgi:hypothetical protein